MLNRQVLEGNWNEIKGKVREKWGQLTDDDLEAAKGKGDQLVGTIQRKTGVAREQIERFLDQAVEEGASIASRAVETTRRYAQRATGELERATHDVGESLGAGYEQAQRLVRDRPTQSLAAVFGLGVVGGMLLGLIMHRR